MAWENLNMGVELDTLYLIHHQEFIFEEKKGFGKVEHEGLSCVQFINLTLIAFGSLVFSAKVR